MKLQSRSLLTGIANFLAIFVVVGVVVQTIRDDQKARVVSSSESVIVMDVPLLDDLRVHRRDLRSKGGSKGSTFLDVDCIPLYPTPAPTKGKGKGRVKIYNKSTTAMSASTKKSTKKSTKGSSSAAPSFFCSDAPSMVPSVSSAPSVTSLPSLSPSVSSAPSCFGKGKGRLGVSSCKTTSMSKKSKGSS